MNVIKMFTDREDIKQSMTKNYNEAINAESECKIYCYVLPMDIVDDKDNNHNI